MVTVVQGKVCAKNHPDRLSRLATIHQRYRRTDGRISYGIGLDLTVGQKFSVIVVILYYKNQQECLKFDKAQQPIFVYNVEYVSSKLNFNND